MMACCCFLSCLGFFWIERTRWQTPKAKYIQVSHRSVRTCHSPEPRVCVSKPLGEGNLNCKYIVNCTQTGCSTVVKVATLARRRGWDRLNGLQEYHIIWYTLIGYVGCQFKPKTVDLPSPSSNSLSTWLEQRLNSVQLQSSINSQPKRYLRNNPWDFFALEFFSTSPAEFFIAFNQLRFQIAPGTVPHCRVAPRAAERTPAQSEGNWWQLGQLKEFELIHILDRSHLM